MNSEEYWGKLRKTKRMRNTIENWMYWGILWCLGDDEALQACWWNSWLKLWFSLYAVLMIVIRKRKGPACISLYLGRRKATSRALPPLDNSVGLFVVSGCILCIICVCILICVFDWTCVTQVVFPFVFEFFLLATHYGAKRKATTHMHALH